MTETTITNISGHEAKQAPRTANPRDVKASILTAARIALESDRTIYLVPTNAGLAIETDVKAATTMYNRCIRVSPTGSIIELERPRDMSTIPLGERMLLTIA